MELRVPSGTSHVVVVLTHKALMIRELVRIHWYAAERLTHDFQGSPCSVELFVEQLLEFLCTQTAVGQDILRRSHRDVGIIICRCWVSWVTTVKHKASIREEKQDCHHLGNS